MKTVVEIEWDSPEEQAWLCADNISIALHAYCKNTKFKVRSLDAELAAATTNNASNKVCANTLCSYCEFDGDCTRTDCVLPIGFRGRKLSPGA